MIETAIAITVTSLLVCMGRTAHAYRTCRQAIEFVLKEKIKIEKLKWYDWLLSPAYVTFGSVVVGPRTFTEKGRQRMIDQCRDDMLYEVTHTSEQLVLINRELTCYVYPALKMLNV